MTATVTLSNIDHWFGSHHVLKDIALEIPAGDYITLLGPSGCGKTTLLSVLGGFILPTRGSVRIGEKDMTRVPPARRPTTTMFQDYALFPHMTLRDNVSFGPRMAGVSRRERHARADALLELVGLHDAGDKRPHALSGGQRQRVALARALAVEPDVLLLDEPLGALDLKLRRAMQDELKHIQRKLGTTFVHVTHDQEEAMAISDRIVVLNGGRIEDQGPPARIYRQPATLFAADFMGEMNHLQGTSDGRSVSCPFGTLAGDASGALPAGRVSVCIRPEAILAGDGEIDLGWASVSNVTFFGSYARVQLTSDTTHTPALLAHWPITTLPGQGDRLRLCTSRSDIHVFAETPIE